VGYQSNTNDYDSELDKLDQQLLHPGISVNNQLDGQFRKVEVNRTKGDIEIPEITWIADRSTC
jgi:hypothetical protein